MIETHTIQNRRLINNNKNKFINAIFGLSKLRQMTESGDPYVRAYVKGNDSLADRLDADFFRDEEARLWSPFIRFDATKVIPMLFGNLDFDFQNALISYQSATAVQYGVQVYENNFGNIVSRRNEAVRGQYTQESRNRPALFSDYIAGWLEHITDSTVCEARIIPLEQCANFTGFLNSSGPAKRSRDTGRLTDMLKTTSESLAQMLGNSFGQPRSRDSSRRTPETTRPSLLFFQITGTEPQYSYADGHRLSLIHI